MALLISGRYDAHWGGASFSASTFIPQWRSQVVDVVLAANSRNTVHTFICTPKATYERNKIRDNHTYPDGQPDWSHLRHGRRTDVLIVPDDAFNITRSPHSTQWERMERCYLAARAFEDRLLRDAVGAFLPILWTTPSHNMNSTGLKFTHFIRARPDILWRGPISLASFDPDFVHLRSRALLSADECDVTSAFALAFPPCRPKWQNPNFPFHRQRMKEQGISACSALDDMFAVLPSHLGDAFFLTSSTLNRRLPPEILPNGWNMSRSLASIEAIRATYGFRMSIMEYSKRCIKVVSYFNALMNYNGGLPEGSWREPEDSLTSKKLPTQEDRMTMRVIARSLPFRISPFLFMELWYPQHKRDLRETWFC